MAASSSSTGTARLNFVRFTATTYSYTSSSQDVMHVGLRQFREENPLYRVKLNKQSRRNRLGVPTVTVSRIRNSNDVPFAIIELSANNPSKASIRLGHGQNTNEVQIDLTPTIPMTSQGERKSSIKDSQLTANMIKILGLKLPGNPRLAFSWNLSSFRNRIPSASQYTSSVSAPEISSDDKHPASSSSANVERSKDVRAPADVLHLVDQYGERYATYFNTSTGDTDRSRAQQGPKQGESQEMLGYLEILSHLIDHEFTDCIVATLVAVLECHLRAVEEGKSRKSKTGDGPIPRGCVVC